MIMKYLGTAASEAVPAPFCECDTCEYARRHGGRNIQTRAQAIIDHKEIFLSIVISRSKSLSF